jgi:hypothetical protein
MRLGKTVKKIGPLFFGNVIVHYAFLLRDAIIRAVTVRTLRSTTLWA